VAADLVPGAATSSRFDARAFRAGRACLRLRTLAPRGARASVTAAVAIGAALGRRRQGNECQRENEHS
jgi:hypothetical protein